MTVPAANENKTKEICECHIGITNVFHKGNCIKCGKKVTIEKPYTHTKTIAA